jgi:hypothetical protein
MARNQGGGGLSDQPFAFRATKDGKVFITWRGLPALTLQGKKAETFLARISDLNEERQQLVMAKATGNFKRGNESKFK